MVWGMLKPLQLCIWENQTFCSSRGAAACCLCEKIAFFSCFVSLSASHLPLVHKGQGQSSGSVPARWRQRSVKSHLNPYSEQLLYFIIATNDRSWKLCNRKEEGFANHIGNLWNLEVQVHASADCLGTTLKSFKTESEKCIKVLLMLTFLVL